LISAIASGDPELARLLLARGVDPNAADNRGNTALMFAVAGRLKAKDVCPVCKQLLACGANPAAKNSLDQTAYEISQAQGDSEIKKNGGALLVLASQKTR
jgi:ankyrin repeat protein